MTDLVVVEKRGRFLTYISPKFIHRQLRAGAILLAKNAAGQVGAVKKRPRIPLWRY